MEAWLLATAAAATIWGLISIAAKKLKENSSGPTYTYLYSLIALVFYTPAFLYFLTTETLKFTPLVVLAFVISGLANIFGFWFYNK